mgnify:FL=1
MIAIRHRRLTWGGLLLVAVLIRIAAALVWQARLGEGESFAFPDSESYWELGRLISQGQKYEFADARAFRTPGYPLLLAPLFVVFGEEPPVLAARIVGSLLGGVVVFAVGVLTWKLFDERTGLIAALLCALYPGAIAMSILVLSEAIFCPLMVAQLWCWSAAVTAQSRRNSVLFASLAGIAAGLATLARPSWLLFTPLAVGLSLVIGKTRSTHLRVGLAMLMSLVMTMSPWWVRNAVVLHAFVPTTTQVGASLYDGLHPGATGASDMRFVPPVREAYRNEWNEQESSTEFEVALNRHFMQQASEFVQANPVTALRLAAIKFARMWNVWPNEASLRSWPMRVLVAIGYLPILISALLGAWKFARDGWGYMLCLLPAGYFTLLHMIFVGSIRYRQPPMLLLVVLAAGWIASQLLGRWKQDVSDAET